MPVSSTHVASASASSSSSGLSKPAFIPSYPPWKKAAAHGTKRPVVVDKSDESDSDDVDAIGHEDDYSSIHDITQMKNESFVSHYPIAPKCVNCQCAAELISRHAFLDSHYNTPLSPCLTLLSTAVSLHPASPFPQSCCVQCAF